MVFDAAKTKEHERLSDLIIDENSDCEKTTTPEQERPSALIDENSNIKFSQPFLCEDIHISSYESANTQENTLNILNHSIFQKMNETTKYTQKVDYKKNGLAAKLTELIRNKKERSQDLESYRTIKVIHSARLYSRLLIQFSFDDTQNTQDPEQNFLFLHESTTKFIKNGHQFQLFFENENLQVIKKGSWNIYVNISKIKAVSGN